eukprot:GHVT01063430.1.p1 GENE.GHVT01063430.1~~GHVT01063430.1.p1  ORF type:complete len:1068 (-),score=147.70 GHVT01063430.1:633-3836(-)
MPHSAAATEAIPPQSFGFADLLTGRLPGDGASLPPELWNLPSDELIRRFYSAAPSGTRPRTAEAQGRHPAGEGADQEADEDENDQHLWNVYDCPVLFTPPPVCGNPKPSAYVRKAGGSMVASPASVTHGASLAQRISSLAGALGRKLRLLPVLGSHGVNVDDSTDSCFNCAAPDSSAALDPAAQRMTPPILGSSPARTPGGASTFDGRPAVQPPHRATYFRGLHLPGTGRPAYRRSGDLPAGLHRPHACQAECQHNLGAALIHHLPILPFLKTGVRAGRASGAANADEPSGRRLEEKSRNEKERMAGKNLTNDQMRTRTPSSATDGKEEDPLVENDEAEQHDEEVWKMVVQWLEDGVAQVIMHEVGHALGLRHNFKGSTGVPFEKLHDCTYTSQHGVSASVMDYFPMNIGSRTHHLDVFSPSSPAYAPTDADPSKEVSPPPFSLSSAAPASSNSSQKAHLDATNNASYPPRSSDLLEKHLAVETVVNKRPAKSQLLKKGGTTDNNGSAFRGRGVKASAGVKEGLVRDGGSADTQKNSEGDDSAPCCTSGRLFSMVIGEYDKLAIRYGYVDLEDEVHGVSHPALAAIGEEALSQPFATDEDDPGPDGEDPYTNMWDLGDEPLLYWLDQLELVKRLRPSLQQRAVRDRESYARYTAAETVLLSQITRSGMFISKYLGGFIFSKAIGTTTAPKTPPTAMEPRDTFTPVRPVAPALQAVAFSALIQIIAGDFSCPNCVTDMKNAKEGERAQCLESDSEADNTLSRWYNDNEVSSRGTLWPNVSTLPFSVTVSGPINSTTDRLHSSPYGVRHVPLPQLALGIQKYFLMNLFSPERTQRIEQVNSLYNEYQRQGPGHTINSPEAGNSAKSAIEDGAPSSEPHLNTASTPALNSRTWGKLSEVDNHVPAVAKDSKERDVKLTELWHNLRVMMEDPKQVKPIGVWGIVQTIGVRLWGIEPTKDSKGPAVSEESSVKPQVAARTYLDSHRWKLQEFWVRLMIHLSTTSSNLEMCVAADTEVQRLYRLVPKLRALHGLEAGGYASNAEWKGFLALQHRTMQRALFPSFVVSQTADTR